MSRFEESACTLFAGFGFVTPDPPGYTQVRAPLFRIVQRRTRKMGCRNRKLEMHVRRAGETWP